MFATPYRVTWDYYFTARNHTLKIDEWTEGELDYVISIAPLIMHLLVYYTFGVF